MARSLIPPRGVFVPTALLFDQHLPEGERMPHAVRDTAIQIMALAWGKTETPPISFSELSELTGKSIPTLYSHMGFLRNKGALRWRHSGTSTIIVELSGRLFEPENSENLELPDLSSLSDKDTKNTGINTSNSENSEILEIQKTGNGAGTRPIRDKYCELLGYVPDNWAAGEGAAAKAIGAKYTIDEFERVYRHMKAQKFWSDKHLMLRQIKPQMQGVLVYLSKNGKGTHASANSTDDADARECAERINAMRGKR